MPLVDHLRELRRRLAVCLLAVVPGTVAGFWFYEAISRFLTAPVCDLQVATASSGQCGPLVISGSLLAPLALQAKVALFTGILASAPVWSYQLWAFVAPALHRHERRWAVGFATAGVPLFLTGAALCYLLLPKGVAFLVGFTPSNVALLADYSSYLSLVLRLILVFGISFLAPVFVIALNLAGALPARKLRDGWRWTVLGVMVFAAVATPTGYPLTMLALGVPVLALLLAAYGVCAWTDRRRLSAAEPAYADDELSPL